MNQNVETWKQTFHSLRINHRPVFNFSRDTAFIETQMSKTWQWQGQGQGQESFPPHNMATSAISER
jgi:hypothetical protein